MGTSYEHPNPASIADLFEIIFGENVGVSDGAAAADITDQHTATFLDPNDNLVAACTCDSAFVTYSGAALSMIPAEVANEMIEDGEITDEVKANFFEVMNICSKLLMSDASAHLRLEKVIAPGQLGDTLSAFEESGTALGFTVDIPRYGRGSLSFLINQP